MAHFYLEPLLKEGDIAVDATCGNGFDTLYMAKKVGPAGQVYAFDIQDGALRATYKRLKEEGLEDRVTLIKAGHEFMDRYLSSPVKAVIYNLGYLPGGDHNITTRAETTLLSFAQALKIIKPGGLIAITMYPGHAAGEEEKEGLLAASKALAKDKFSALHLKLLNRARKPPELLLVEKSA